MNRLLLLGVVLSLSACAPRFSTGGILATPAAVAAETAAQIAFHRMEIGLLQTGEYTTNALLELDLPQGVKWTLQDFSTTTYELRFTSAAVPEVVWEVTPDGVRPERSEE